MVLEQIDYLNGSLSLIVVVISIYVGIRILKKYLEIKERLFLEVGLVAIIISEPWWPHVISFILALLNLEPLSPQLYFILGNVLIPFAILLWLSAFAKLKYPEKKGSFLIGGIVYLAIYEIVFFSFLAIDHSLIGQCLGSLDVQYGIGLIGLLTTALFIIIITGVMFAMESFKEDNPEIKMKGRFLLIGFISFCTGAAIDVLIMSNPISLIIARILLVIAAIGFLGGFVPPEFLKPKDSKT